MIGAGHKPPTRIITGMQMIQLIVEIKFFKCLGQFEHFFLIACR